MVALLAESNTLTMTVVTAGILALFVIVLITVLRQFIIICEPNEVLILSGRQRRLSDGSAVGYRVIKGGRAFRIPIIEKASKLDLNTMPIELHVANAYSKGGIPLNVDAIANVKVNGDEPWLGNAVERFLDVRVDSIRQIAKETLEGNLRGVLATLTPEEVNEDRLKFAGSLIEEAGDDMGQLGLQLDTLKIQNVVDEAGYLDSIGRRKTAQVLKDARVAEAERSSEASQSEARAHQDAEIARVKADQEIVEQQNKLRVRKAELEAIALAKEQEALVAGEKARVKAQQELEHERIEREKRRLEADIIQPARADMEAKEMLARGQAARILEDGKARVNVLEQMIGAYQSAAGEGETVFVLNMLPEIIREMVSTVQGVAIDKVTVIDGGGSSNGAAGGALPGLLAQLPGSVIKMTEQIENATGINILSRLQQPDAQPEETGATPAPAAGAKRRPTKLTPPPAKGSRGGGGTGKGR